MNYRLLPFLFIALHALVVGCNHASFSSEGIDSSSDAAQDAQPDVTENISPWADKASQRCRTELAVHESYENWEFQEPQNPERPIRTIEGLIEQTPPGSHSSATTLISVQPANNLEPFPGTTMGFAREGEDITIHLVIGTTRPGQAFRFEIAVLLDYEPVTFRYERLNDDRSEVIDRGESRGLGWRSEGRWAAFDITIPAEQFEAGRLHDVALFSTVSDADFPAGRSASSDRVMILYGGADLPHVPDPICHSDDTYNEIEHSQAAESITRSLLMLAGDDVEDRLPDSPVEVTPGQEVDLLLTLAEAQMIMTGTIRLVAVPLIDGAPFAEPIWYQDRIDEDQPNRAVSHRDYLTVRMPDQPGEYIVRVASWRQPFEPYMTVDGTKLPERFSGSGRLHTNSLIFRVVE